MANGMIKCTISNWTGVAYKIPRTKLEACKDRADLYQSGVYFLFGTSDQSDDNNVYIGQAGIRKSGDGILNRLIEHKRNPDKDYWTEAVIFTTSNNSFGPTEISYLENRFCRMAVDAKRYIVKNGNDPTSGNITEEKESELEYFIDYSKLIIATLGYSIFEPLVKNVQQKDNNVPDQSDLQLFFRRKSGKSGRIIVATCRQTNEGFVVLKGSSIELIDSDSVPPGIRIHREKAKIDENGILQEDRLFKSPSYAAAFVIGGHVNGLMEWKNVDGVSLKEIENKEI